MKRRIFMTESQLMNVIEKSVKRMLLKEDVFGYDENDDEFENEYGDDGDETPEEDIVDNKPKPKVFRDKAGKQWTRDEFGKLVPYETTEEKPAKYTLQNCDQFIKDANGDKTKLERIFNGIKDEALKYGMNIFAKVCYEKQRPETAEQIKKNRINNQQIESMILKCLAVSLGLEDIMTEQGVKKAKSFDANMEGGATFKTYFYSRVKSASEKLIYALSPKRFQKIEVNDADEKLYKEAGTDTQRAIDAIAKQDQSEAMEKLWSMFPSRTFHSFDDIPKGEVPSVFRVVNGDDYNYYESIYDPYDNNDYDIDINKTNDEKDKAMSQIANISSDEADYGSEITKEKLDALKNKYNADKYNLAALEENKENENKEIINESLKSVKGLIDRMANL